MKKIVSFLAISLAAALASGSIVTVSDDFNDGVRNKTLWRVDASQGGVLVEKNGVLYGYSGTNNPQAEFHSAQWELKPVQWSVYGQIYEVEARVRCPDKAPGTNASAFVWMELGWFIPGSIPRVAAAGTVWLDHTHRVLNICLYKPDITSIGGSAALPTLSSTIRVKLRYYSKTGMVGLYWREDGDHPWALARSLDLNKAWNISIGTSLYVRPYLKFLSCKCRVVQPKAYFFDDFYSRIITPVLGPPPL